MAKRKNYSLFTTKMVNLLKKCSKNETETLVFTRSENLGYTIIMHNHLAIMLSNDSPDLHAGLTMLAELKGMLDFISGKTDIVAFGRYDASPDTKILAEKLGDSAFETDYEHCPLPRFSYHLRDGKETRIFRNDEGKMTFVDEDYFEILNPDVETKFYINNGKFPAAAATQNECELFVLFMPIKVYIGPDGFPADDFIEMAKEMEKYE